MDDEKTDLAKKENVGLALLDNVKNTDKLYRVLNENGKK